MQVSSRRRFRLCVAAAAGLAAPVLLDVRLAHAQQSPNDQTVFLNANDASGASSFFGGPAYQWGASVTTYSTTPYTNATTLAAGTAPTAGYAYVVTGSAAGTGMLRTPANGSTGVTFAGDSLTILPYNGQANLYNTSTSIVNAMDATAVLAISGNTSGQAITVNNLVLGNGGAVVNYNASNTVLNGSIYLLPAGTTIDGITTTVNGGIIDPRKSGTTSTTTNTGLTVNASLNGAGLLHILSTNNTQVTALSLNSSNPSFTGGILLDNTVGTSATSGSSTNPILNINSPSALGTGTLTIGSLNAAGVTVGTGPTIDNATGAVETLTTNNAIQLNGSVNFLGSNSLNMGTGTLTLGASGTITSEASILYIHAINANGNTLTVAGNTPSAGAVEVPSVSSISGSFTVANGGTLAFPAASTSPSQFAAEAVNSGFATTGALVGIDTTGVVGTYNLSGSLPAGSYGINKVGAGTLLLSGSNAYTGYTVITTGTLQLGNANAISNSGYTFFGQTSGTPNGTLDVNGISATLTQIAGGGNGGKIINSSATLSTLTLQSTPNSFIPISGFYGSISGAISLVVNYGALGTNATTDALVLGGTDTYTGTTTLQSGALAVTTNSGLPAVPQSIIFAGGYLYLDGTGIDPSASFNQGSGQLYNILLAGNNTFASSLNSPGGALTVGNLNYGGNGTLNLTGVNNFTGTTEVIYQTLELSNPKSIAGTSGITVDAYTPFAIGSAPENGTLQINDNSGLLGLTGGVAGGAPITLTLNGMGTASSFITHRVGITNHIVGNASYGALQGVAGSSDTWAGNIVLGGNGPVGISGGFNNTSGGGVLTVSGVISGTGPLVLGLNGNSYTVLAGSNTYSGETQINCSTGVATTVQLGANFGIPADSGLNFSYNPAYLSISSTYAFGTQTFDLNGFNTSTAYVTSTYASNVITNNAAGTTSVLTIMGPSPTTAYLGAYKDGTSGGKLGLNFDGGTQYMTGTNNYSGGTTVTAGLLIASSLPAIGTGNITLNGNTGGGAIIQNTPLSTLFLKAQTGFNGGAWNGSGINSTYAASDPSHLTAVGMFQPTSSMSFEGQTVNSTDVALKLTYYGDANLDGQVDGSDYTLIDNGYNNQLTGWQNGDFNYDGVIDGSDYTLIDNAFNTQGSQFAAEVASQTAQIGGGSAVPEPASMGLIAMAALGGLVRRRRR